MEPTTWAAIASALGKWFSKDKSDFPGGELMAAINQSLTTITRHIVESTYAVGDNTNTLLEDVANRVIAQILNSQYGVNQNVDEAERTILEYIEAAARAVDRSSYNRDNTILDTIGSGNRYIEGVISKQAGAILTPMLQGQADTAMALAGLDINIGNSFNRVEGVFTRILDFIEREINYVINNTITIDDSVFGTVLDNVRRVLLDQNEITRAVINNADRLINGTFAEALTLNREPLIDTAKDTGRSADALEYANKLAEETLDPVSERARWDKFMEGGIPGIEATIGLDDDELKRSYDDLVKAVLGNENPRLDDDCLVPLLTRGPGKGIGWWIANILTTAMAAGVMPFQMATIQANRKIKGFRTCFPDLTFTEVQLREMYHILGYDKRDLVPFMQMSGWSKDDAEVIMASWQTVPDITLLTSMMYRQVITERDWQTEMRKHGFTQKMIEGIFKITSYLPPVQDLITMSVRDVFDPATVAANRQYEDYPQDFTKYMQQQGVPEYWAKQYWGAHWRLPSETMGFEMFHRGIINEAELKGLMKSLDIMPGWRDRLIKLSYNPLTRVDVRRMHSVGVLSDKEVTRAYLDIGYSPENAERLTDFTVRLNEGEGVASLNIMEDLTRANVLAFYRDGTIDREVALGLLLQEGVGAAAAHLLLENEDLKLEQLERKQLRKLILTRFETGTYTFEQAVTEAQRLNFGDREREQIILDLELIQAKEHKLPSKPDLDKMLKAGVIDQGVYKVALNAHGYSDYWVDRYIELAGMNDE